MCDDVDIDIDIDIDSDSHDDEIECIKDILQNILSIQSYNKDYIGHIQSHSTLITFTDLLKTHIIATNNIDLISLLYICIKKNK